MGTKAQRGVGTKLPREGFIRVTQWGVGTEPRQRKGLGRECETEEELGRGHEKEEGLWAMDLGIRVWFGNLSLFFYLSTIFNTIKKLP